MLFQMVPRICLRQLSGLMASTSFLGTGFGCAMPEVTSVCRGQSIGHRAFSTATYMFSPISPRNEIEQLQNPPRPPWTPTKDLTKRKCYTKRMGHMLQVLEKEMVENVRKDRKVPDFGPGHVLQIKMAVPENKKRPAIIKGTCIAKVNRGWRTSFTIRNHITQAGAFERTFPLYSPNIQDIAILDKKPVRRSKLYYLRQRQPKEYRVQ